MSACRRQPARATRRTPLVVDGSDVRQLPLGAVRFPIVPSVDENHARAVLGSGTRAPQDWLGERHGAGGADVRLGGGRGAPGRTCRRRAWARGNRPARQAARPDRACGSRCPGPSTPSVFTTRVFAHLPTSVSAEATRPTALCTHAMATPFPAGDGRNGESPQAELSVRAARSLRLFRLATVSASTTLSYHSAGVGVIRPGTGRDARVHLLLVGPGLDRLDPCLHTAGPPADSS